MHTKDDRGAVFFLPNRIEDRGKGEKAKKRIHLAKKNVPREEEA